MKYKAADLQVKAAGTADGLEEGVFTAYASVYGNVDSYGDVVRKGAFADSLKAWAEKGNTLPVLYGHDMADVFANIGGVIEAKEDDHGLLVKAQLDLENPTAKQVYKLLKGRRLSQMSFAYSVEESAPTTVEGKDATELSKLSLYEVSVVPIGANQETEILAVKSHADLLRKAGDQFTAEQIEANEPDENTADDEASADDEAKADEAHESKSDRVSPEASARLRAAQLTLLGL